MSWWDVAMITVFAYIGHGLNTWKWSACTCKRSKIPYFFEQHEKHWLMLVLGWLCTGSTVVSVWAIDWWGSLVGVVVTVWVWTMVKYHGRGRRKWLEKAQGYVQLNEHGRLVVVNAK